MLKGGVIMDVVTPEEARIAGETWEWFRLAAGTPGPQALLQAPPVPTLTERSPWPGCLRAPAHLHQHTALWSVCPPTSAATAAWRA